MKHFYFISVCFLVLLVFQVACGQTQTAVNNKDQNSTTDLGQPISNSGVNKKEEQNEVDYFAHLRPEHKKVLQVWLAEKAFLRPASERTDNTFYEEKYKDHLEDNLRSLREYVGKDGYQYYSKGDFNRDGKEDFAVLLVDDREKDGDSDWFALAIFNGPFKPGQVPSYYEEELHGISNSYIVFNGIMENRLFLGKFESDYYCATYFPKGKTYRFEDCFD